MQLPSDTAYNPLESFKPLEAAKLIHVSKNLVYEMIHTGQLKSIRAGSKKKTILVPAWAILEFQRSAKSEDK